MDLFEAIKKRHSYRGRFRDVEIPRAMLKKIVKAGICAPTGANAQTTEFIIVDAPELLKQIAEIEFEEFDRLVIDSAKAIVVCIIRHEEIYPGISFGLEDCCAAIENMLLAITALNLASVWIDGIFAKYPERAQKIAELLGIPEDRSVRVVLPLGFPEHQCSQKPKKRFSERAWFNKYGE